MRQRHEKSLGYSDTGVRRRGQLQHLRLRCACVCVCGVTEESGVEGDAVAVESRRSHFESHPPHGVRGAQHYRLLQRRRAHQGQLQLQQ